MNKGRNGIVAQVARGLTWQLGIGVMLILTVLLRKFAHDSRPFLQAFALNVGLFLPLAFIWTRHHRKNKREPG